ncbi:MAG: CbiX/SirB N-terminal domain-containing protein, partial [Gammaproteobacteria bacterium]
MSEVILLVGHGSREPAGNREVEDFATRWRARHPEWDIELCFIAYGCTIRSFISDEDVIATAKSANTTRAIESMRKAHRLGVLDG